MEPFPHQLFQVVKVKSFLFHNNIFNFLFQTVSFQHFRGDSNKKCVLRAKLAIVYLYTVLSRKYAPPPPPPNGFDENYCTGIIISEDSDCD